MRRRLPRFALTGALAIGIALAFASRERFAPQGIQAWIEGLGAWGAAAFVGVYLVAPSLFLPGSALTLAGGALFGPLRGALLSLVGATGGAAMAFLIARYLAGAAVERRVSGRLQELKVGAERGGWRFVAFTRLVPIFPFNLLNYAFGVTRIPLATFVATSFLAMAPGAFAYAYLGYVGREALAGGPDLARKAALALSLLAALALLPSIVRRSRAPASISPAELQRLSRPEPPVILDVRSPAELAGPLGRIEGALNIPVDEVFRRLDELRARQTSLLVPV